MATALADARRAVGRAHARVIDLAPSSVRSDAPAVGHWSVADTLAHLSHVFAFDVLAAKGVSSPNEADLPEFVRDPTIADRIFAVRNVDDVARINDEVLEADPERDLERLLRRIDTSLAELDTILASQANGEAVTVTWLGGVTLPLVAIPCHVLFELNGHGIDLARASGRRWQIDTNDVLLILEGFMSPVMEAGVLALPESVADLTGAIDVRLRGLLRTNLLFEAGRARFSPTGPSPDFHISVDPETFLLLSLGRTGRLGPALRGKIVAWGRHPLRGARMLNALQTP